MQVFGGGSTRAARCGGGEDKAHARSFEALTKALRVCDQPFNWTRGGEEDGAFWGGAGGVRGGVRSVLTIEASPGV